MLVLSVNTRDISFLRKLVYAIRNNIVYVMFVTFLLVVFQIQQAQFLYAAFCLILPVIVLVSVDAASSSGDFKDKLSLGIDSIILTYRTGEVKGILLSDIKSIELIYKAYRGYRSNPGGRSEVFDGGQNYITISVGDEIIPIEILLNNKNQWLSLEQTLQQYQQNGIRVFTQLAW